MCLLTLLEWKSGTAKHTFTMTTVPEHANPTQDTWLSTGYADKKKTLSTNGTEVHASNLTSYLNSTILTLYIVQCQATMSNIKFKK